MNIETIIGLVASVLTAIALLPQLIELIQKKKPGNVSIGMLLTLLGGHILWITYGVMKEDWIIIVSNSVSLVFDIITIVLVLRYRKKPGH